MSEESRADEHDSHEGQCPICYECTCVGCGCADTSGLIHIEFGLQPFVQEAHCPKCNSKAVHSVYHSCLVLSMGEKSFPCEAWQRSGILTGDIGEHLCLRCQRCGYGWPSQTADTFRIPPMDEQHDPEELL
jgi:hypothetical protein